MTIQDILDQYDLTEIFNRKPKKIVESKMKKDFKLVYYILQYSREIFLVTGIILFLIWLFNKNQLFFAYSAILIISAGIFAVITQKMRKYIIDKYSI